MKKDNLFIVKTKNSLTLKACMERIEENTKGMVFVVDEDKRCLGLLTDGDIRRALIDGASVGSDVTAFLNKEYRRVPYGASREQVLKLLDHRIRIIPVEQDGKILEILTKDDLAYVEQESVIARSKAPARISFGGGGTDLTGFFVKHGGAVLNATINLYSHCTLHKRSDTKVRIHSRDFGVEVQAESLKEMPNDGALALIIAAIKILNPSFGFDLEIRCDFPAHSGLGGSSVALAAVIGCFNQFRADKLNAYDIAELAFQSERIELAYAGGWQDQYASVFGGFNFMEFQSEKNEITSLKVPQEVVDELEHRLVLCYSGQPHPKGKIHEAQSQRMLHVEEVNRLAQQARDIAYRMKSFLIRGRLDDLGDLLDQGWQLKKSFSDEITTQSIDELYTYARKHGAAGGKILGAGGGGYFLLQASRDKKAELVQALQARGLQTKDFGFEFRGVHAWLVPRPHVFERN